MTDEAIRTHCNETTTRAKDNIDCVVAFQQLRAKGAAFGSNCTGAPGANNQSKLVDIRERHQPESWLRTTANALQTSE